jgi:protein-L-isoaspartate(D-aspartate) O-methyltransferase
MVRATIFPIPIRSLWVAAALCLGVNAAGADEADLREEMVRVIERYAWHMEAELGQRHLDQRVLQVMRRLPRHDFVPDDVREEAYADRPLPIGHGQTISQPFIVAFMSHLLEPQPDHVVLEIGTGSGYQAAVLAEIVERVCTIEIIPGLGESAKAALEAMNFANVRTKIGDGYHGWPECGPYDGIVVTAAAGHVPPPLIEQLKPGARMIIPVGEPYSTQQLVLVTKEADGHVTTRQMLPVRFVPFVRGSP